MAVSEHERERERERKRKRKRKRKIQSKSESNGEEGQSNRKAKSAKHKRLKRKVKMEEGCSEGDREKRDRKVSRKRKIKMELGCSQGVRVKHHKVEHKVKKQPEPDLPSKNNCNDWFLAKLKSDPWLVDRKLILNSPRTLQWVELALAHHAREQGVEFENVEVVSENCRFIVTRVNIPQGWYCHLFFKAKPRNVLCTNLSPMPFFAELYVCGEDIRILHCSIVDPNDPGTTRGCGLCPALNYLVHPATGYIAGHYPYRPPVSRGWPCFVPG